MKVGFIWVTVGDSATLAYITERVIIINVNKLGGEG